MKIALLNDTHFGARNDSLIFDDFFHKFYDEVFFPYLKEHNIKTLIHLGDVVDRRKFIITLCHEMIHVRQFLAGVEVSEFSAYYYEEMLANQFYDEELANNFEENILDINED